MENQPEVTPFDYLKITINDYTLADAYKMGYANARTPVLREVAEYLEVHPDDLLYDNRWLFIIRLKAGLLP